jgi:hypothetical protein
MNKALSRRISIFLTVDDSTINDYFNPHDPAPIYKRQLRHDFIQYILESVHSYKKYSTVTYKVSYNLDNKSNLDPFMHAVRRHFYVREQMKKAEFERFKKSSYKLLFLSLSMVMVCQGLMPFVVSAESRLYSSLHNYLDVFSWVILWRPIDRLIFHWNPFLKELSLLHKLANAEIIAIAANHEEIAHKMLRSA